MNEATRIKGSQINDRIYLSPRRNNSPFQPLFSTLERLGGDSWERFKSYCLRKPSPLQGELRDIKENFSDYSYEQIEEKFIEAIKAKNFSLLSKDLKKIFKKLMLEEKNLLIQNAIYHCFENGQSKNINRCLDFITLQDLQELIPHISKEFESLEKTAEQVAETFIYIEKYKQDPNSQKLQAELKRQKPVVISFFKNLISNFVRAFNLLEVGRPPGTYYETKYMLDIYWKFFAIPKLIIQGLMFYFLNPFVALGIFAALTVATFAGLYIYLRWVNPCPDAAPGCENLTSLAKKGQLDPVFGRDEELQSLITDLISSSKGKTPKPLILGETGVGKTTLLDALALRIAEGNVPPELKGKTVFKINTAEFLKNCPSYNAKDPLQELFDTIGGNVNDIILCCDEFQSIFEGEKNSNVAVRLKDQLQSLPYFIGVTTKKEYDDYILPNPSLTRRLKPIYISDTTLEKTVIVLQNIIQRQFPDLEISEETLKSIYNLTKENLKNRCQPEKSNQVLFRAMAEISLQLEGNNLQADLRKISDKREQKALILSRKKMDGRFLSSSGCAQILKKIRKKDDKIEEINQQIQNHKMQLEEYQFLRKVQKNQEKIQFKLAPKILKNKSLEEQKLFLLSLFYITPALDKFITDMAKNCHIHNVIDQEMIERIVKHLTDQEAGR